MLLLKVKIFEVHINDTYDKVFCETAGYDTKLNIKLA